MSSASSDADVFQLLSMTESCVSDLETHHARLFPVLRKAVKDASEAIVVTEARLERPGPRILWVNPSFTEITGYERSEVLGKTPRILQGPETDEWVLSRLRNQLQEGNRFEGETINYRKDGTPYVNHWSIAPVYDDNDSISYWVSIQRDVTEKRRLQREVLQAQDKERQRIGRELHDSVSSNLASARMMLDNVLQRDFQEEALVSRLEDIRALIGRGYEDLRDLTHGLSPVDLSEKSIMVAFDNLSSRFSEVRFESEGIDLDTSLSNWNFEELTHLYWIVKEATINALKYAEADTIVIRAGREEEGYALSVEDDGVGFVPDEHSSEGWGLQSMRYRADLLNARLEIDSQSGEGTRVTCHFKV